MKTYKETFEKLKNKNEGALAAFTVIGDPDYKTSLEITKKIVDAGADMLELGMPFSDPIADGPTIQAANIRALGSGMSTDKAFDFVKELRKYTNIPIGFLCYYNLIYQRSVSKFYSDAKYAEINSILIADMPIEEHNEVLPHLHENNMDIVLMVTPITSDERINKIAKASTGFVYAVSRLGVTGVKSNLEESAMIMVKRIRKLTTKPLCVGFGISKPEHVKAMINAGADGVIVGSAIVELIAKNLDNKDKMIDMIYNYVKEMKSATMGQ